MAIGVNARTAFSLFFPPIVDEFGWERGVTAGAFSFGFVVSGAVSPLRSRASESTVDCSMALPTPIAAASLACPVASDRSYLARTALSLNFPAG